MQTLEADVAVATGTVAERVAAQSKTANRNELMSVLRRWNRLKSQETVQQGLDDLLSHSSAHWPEGVEERLAVAEWTPLVDISEDDQEYLIKAELPEVKKEDVKVTAQGGTLTNMGERKFEAEEKGKQYESNELMAVLGAASHSRKTLAWKGFVPNSVMAYSRCIW